MPSIAFEDATRGCEPTCVVAVVGYSNRGKTTLLEQLVPLLHARDLSVGVVKHASHGFTADQPGKDSHRVYSAGASAVTVASREQLATFRRRPGTDVGLAEALAEMPAGLDLVLVEGFAWEAVPRVVLVRGGESLAPDHLGAGPVLGVIDVGPASSPDPPCFEGPVLDEVVDQLVERVRTVRAAGSRARFGRRQPWLPITPQLAEEGT